MYRFQKRLFRKSSTCCIHVCTAWSNSQITKPSTSHFSAYKSARCWMGQCTQLYSDRNSEYLPMIFAFCFMRCRHYCHKYYKFLVPCSWTGYFIVISGPGQPLFFNQNIWGLGLKGPSYKSFFWSYIGFYWNIGLLLGLLTPKVTHPLLKHLIRTCSILKVYLKHNST